GEVVKRLAATLHEAKELLRDFAQEAKSGPLEIQSTGSLVDQCIALCEERRFERKEPVRIVHHFACTGGTLICKCIAAMPNTQLLSEVNPLNAFSEVMD